jgi:hypothetical protein
MQDILTITAFWCSLGIVARLYISLLFMADRLADWPKGNNVYIEIETGFSPIDSEE